MHIRERFEGDEGAKKAIDTVCDEGHCCCGEDRSTMKAAQLWWQDED